MSSWSTSGRQSDQLGAPSCVSTAPSAASQLYPKSKSFPGSTSDLESASQVSPLEGQARDLQVPFTTPVSLPSDANAGPPRYGTAEWDARFAYEPPYRKPYPPTIGFLRTHIFKIFVAGVWFSSFALFDLFLAEESWAGFAKLKVLSVPLVCMMFTWFHVWLALQMMFFPIKFFGIGQPIVPDWLGLPINGWQGIVPRKAGVMAERACKALIGNIVSTDEFMDRINPAHFFETLDHVMGGVTAEVMERIMVKRWPKLWEAVPASVKAEVKVKILDDMKKSFVPMHQELKLNINTILNIQQMAIDKLVAQPKMMVDIFRKTGERELGFITHVAATMGFVLGLVQTGLYIWNNNGGGLNAPHYKYFDYVLLPVSGLIIGYFTNYLAIKMTFFPISAHIICGGYGNIQGVFLKRQKEASIELAKLVCSQIIDAKAMLEYMLKSDPDRSTAGVDKVLEIYQTHIDRTIDQTVGMARTSIPNFLGDGIDGVKKDVIDFSLEILPQHSTEIEKYIDEVMCVEETLSLRLSRVPPAEFEQIMHPIFEDDEWILLCVGGLLGIIIGLLQAYVMNL